jgi:hypothetical protein
MNNQHDQLRSTLRNAASVGVASNTASSVSPGSAAGSPDVLNGVLRDGRARSQRRTVTAGGVLAGVIALSAVVGLSRLTGDEGRSKEVVPAVSAPSISAAPTTAPPTTLSTTAVPSTSVSPTTLAPTPVDGVVSAQALLSDGTLVMIDPVSGATLVTIHPASGVQTPARSLNYNPSRMVIDRTNGSTLLGRPVNLPNGYQTIDVVRVLPDGSEESVVGEVTAFALDPTGTRLAYARQGTFDGTNNAGTASSITERSLVTGEERSWVHPGYGLQAVIDLNFSPDGSRLVYSASFETAEVFVLDTRTDDSNAVLITPNFGAEGSTVDSLNSVDWVDDNTVAVVGRCCYAEGEPAAEVFTMRLNGDVVERVVLEGAVAVDVDRSGGWWAITRASGADILTTFVTVRSPDGVLKDYPIVTAMAID